MARVCEICGKGTVFGHNVPRKGLAKKKGGAGQHIGVKTKRTWKPNIMRVKTNLNGTVTTIKICARCLKSNKVVKAV